MASRVRTSSYYDFYAYKLKYGKTKSAMLYDKIMRQTQNFTFLYLGPMYTNPFTKFQHKA